MKIIKIGEPKVIMSNPESKHSYFGWPTATRLQNGKIAVVASGFRERHICPFGKTVISYSENDGETYTMPAPVIDTVLDDRDGGITPFGKSGVIVTSFNNTVDFQKRYSQKYGNAYDLAYLDRITPEEEKKALGANFRISNDCGVTFGPIFKSPITSPHGPVEIPDGTLLWIGRTFSKNNTKMGGIDGVQAHKINPDGSMEFVGAIDNIEYEGKSPLSCEPHAIVLDDGTILAHIRMEEPEIGMLTIYQSISEDGGKTWTKPKQILSHCGGAPPHLFKHSSGLLICTYGFRGEPYGQKPYGIKAMFSTDNGNTWDVGYSLYETEISLDLGYPTTVELADKSMITVFYAVNDDKENAVVLQQKWSFEQ